MADNKKKESPQAPHAAPTGGAGPSGPVHCTAEKCNEKVFRFGFCKVHHEQYEFGLIKGDGHRAFDFEKKVIQFQDYVDRKKSAKKVA